MLEPVQVNPGISSWELCFAEDVTLSDIANLRPSADVVTGGFVDV